MRCCKFHSLPEFSPRLHKGANYMNVLENSTMMVTIKKLYSHYIWIVDWRVSPVGVDQIVPTISFKPEVRANWNTESPRKDGPLILILYRWNPLIGQISYRDREGHAGFELRSNWKKILGLINELGETCWLRVMVKWLSTGRLLVSQGITQ